MIIYLIVLIGLLIEYIVGRKNIQYAIPIALLQILLIPPLVKYNIGINLNNFNLAIFIICLGSIRNIFNRKRYFKGINTILILFFFYIVITSALSTLDNESMGEYIKNMIIFTMEYFALAFCFQYINMLPDSVNFFDRTIIITSIIIAGYGFINYIIGFNPYIGYLSLVTDSMDISNAFQLEERGFVKGRISSTFTHPLYLGQCALLLFAYFSFQLKSRWKKTPYCMFLGSLAAMCILCGSRSAIFPLFVVLLFLLINHNAIKILKYIYILFFVGLISYPFLNKDTRTTLKAMIFVWDEKASKKAEFSGSSISLRTDQLNSSVKIIRKNPIIGKGFGYVNDHGKEHSEMLGYESYIFKVLVENGVLGLFIYTWFYFYLYYKLLKKSKRKEDKCRVHALCLSFFLSITLTGITYPFFSIYMFLYFMTYYNIRNNKIERIYKHNYILTNKKISIDNTI